MRQRSAFGFRFPGYLPVAVALGLVLAAATVVTLLLASQPAASSHSAGRHAIAAVRPAASPHSARRQAIPDYNWYPGYYVLTSQATPTAKRAILADPLVKPFTGVQFRYQWADSELSPGDYSAGFAALDADLRRVAAKGKKLLVMLMYKKFDGTSAVPADLRTGPSAAWCSGSYCGELANGTGTSLALLWNAAVEARLKAWIAAMATHLSQSRYINSVAGIVFNETALGTTDTSLLASAGYDPDVYIRALEDNMLAATTAAPRLITILYYEGGFVSMDGKPVNAGQKIGDWLLQHPRTGAGTPDLKPNDPKDIKHPCANPKYQPRIVFAPAVESPDYSMKVTNSFDDSFRYATDPAPNGLHASFLTFSYAGGLRGDNAFTFADVSHSIADHPIPNTARPWTVTRVVPVVKKVALTSPIRVGKIASLTVSVSPPARCTVRVPKVKGLRPKSGGKITWRWRVTTPPGRWPITVSCSNKGKLKLTMRVRPR
jgi:hypothetical protein